MNLFKGGRLIQAVQIELENPKFADDCPKDHEVTNKHVENGTQTSLIPGPLLGAKLRKSWCNKNCSVWKTASRWIMFTFFGIWLNLVSPIWLLFFFFRYFFDHLARVQHWLVPSRLFSKHEVNWVFHGFPHLIFPNTSRFQNKQEKTPSHWGDFGWFLHFGYFGDLHHSGSLDARGNVFCF